MCLLHKSMHAQAVFTGTRVQDSARLSSAMPGAPSFLQSLPAPPPGFPGDVQLCPVGSGLWAASELFQAQQEDICAPGPNGKSALPLAGVMEVTPNSRGRWWVASSSTESRPYLSSSWGSNSSSQAAPLIPGLQPPLPPCPHAELLGQLEDLQCVWWKWWEGEGLTYKHSWGTSGESIFTWRRRNTVTLPRRLSGWKSLCWFPSLEEECCKDGPGVFFGAPWHLRLGHLTVFFWVTPIYTLVIFDFYEFRKYFNNVKHTHMRHRFISKDSNSSVIIYWLSVYLSIIN